MHEHFAADWINARDVLRCDALLLLALAAIHFLDAGIECCGKCVPEMEEGVFFVANVHEHGLETVFNVANAAFENAAYDVPIVGALDVIFFEHSVLEERDALLQFFDVDDEFVARWAWCESDELFHFFD